MSGSTLPILRISTKPASRGGQADRGDEHNVLEERALLRDERLHRHVEERAGLGPGVVEGVGVAALQERQVEPAIALCAITKMDISRNSFEVNLFTKKLLMVKSDEKKPKCGEGSSRLVTAEPLSPPAKPALRAIKIDFECRRKSD